MDFKKVPNKYRPIPFWSWNEALNPSETARQVDEMHKVGIGGFFMHARGGLQTEYMSKDWFDNVTAASAAAKEREMGAWAYDENGWPSGFGNGIVNGLGKAYQQKYLRVSDTKPAENFIAKSGDHYFYYEVNPFYVDLLDKKVTEKFIEVAYRPYYEKYGNNLEGFFTDEPQISRAGIPWSNVFCDEYQKRYSEDITEVLESLCFPVGDYKKVRVQFWKMVTDLFSESFFKPIYDQCTQWGLKLTGHVVMEESFASQLASNGACMPHYEYFHIPGMDWLGRDILPCLTPIQVSSVAEQLGKKQVLSETFALCGHNVSFAELKGIYEWQMVHGINLLCQHLQGYSLRGIRKRDYPPAMYLQQPWWSEYHHFNDAMSRVGKILSEGESRVDLLVIHPQTTAWTKYSSIYGCEHPSYAGSETDIALKRAESDFLALIAQLEEKHIRFHLGDETIMERHGQVENGKLIIGKQKYSKVICSHCEVLLPNTEKLLSEFTAQGGKTITADELDANNIVDRKDITYTCRYYPDFTVHYFTNTSKDRKSANFTVCGKQMDIYTGECTDFCGIHEFEPWGSLLLIEENNAPVHFQPAPQNLIAACGTWEVDGSVANTLTLDRCDYYFDGELQEENGYVLNIAERANALGHGVALHQDYHVTCNHIPETLYLVCESPAQFEISVNGKIIDKKDCGAFFDSSFRKINIANYMICGKNTISFDCCFKQSESFYQSLKKAYLFETERNKLCYDMEIEAIYLVGDFSVNTPGSFTKLPKNAVRYSGEFIIDAPRKTVSLKNLEQQGFPFFAGELSLKGTVNITGENPVLEFAPAGVNAIRVEINGITKTLLTNNRLSLAEFGVHGETTVRLTLVNNLRNLLGPHHLEEGESYSVSPRSFFKELCVWNSHHPLQEWNDDYCFVETSL